MTVCGWLVVFPQLGDCLPYPQLFAQPQLQPQQILATHQPSHVVIRQVLAFELEEARHGKKRGKTINSDGGKKLIKINDVVHWAAFALGAVLKQMLSPSANYIANAKKVYFLPSEKIRQVLQILILLNFSEKKHHF